MTSTGQLTVNFEPRVKFPAYMLATHNQSSQGKRRNLVHRGKIIIESEHEDHYASKSFGNILIQGVLGGYDYANDPYFARGQYA